MLELVVRESEETRLTLWEDGGESALGVGGPGDLGDFGTGDLVVWSGQRETRRSSPSVTMYTC